MNTKILIIYHNDHDGELSAYIVKRKWEHKAYITFLRCSYDESKIDWSKYSNIHKEYIVDYSFKQEEMEKIVILYGMENVTWIDHHKTAIENLNNFTDLPGIRDYSGDYAACMLTYKFFHKYIPPYYVKLVSDRDVWKFKYGNDGKYLYEWLITQDTIPENKNCVWGGIDNIDSALNIGKELYDTKMQRIRSNIKVLGYPSYINIEGKSLPCMKINYSDNEFTSDIGNTIVNENDYPVAWIYWYKQNDDGKLIRINSLRSRKDIDISGYAVSHGGGGHSNAAAWVEILE